MKWYHSFFKNTNVCWILNISIASMVPLALSVSTCKARIRHSLLPLCHSNDISSYLFAFSFLTRMWQMTEIIIYLVTKSTSYHCWYQVLINLKYNLYRVLMNFYVSVYLLTTITIISCSHSPCYCNFCSILLSCFIELF